MRGTSGLEMAALGKTVITAGTGRYEGNGFTIDPPTAAEYLDILSRIHELPPLSAERVRLAKRYAHAVFALKPYTILPYGQPCALVLSRCSRPMTWSTCRFAQALPDWGRIWSGLAMGVASGRAGSARGLQGLQKLMLDAMASPLPLLELNTMGAATITHGICLQQVRGVWGLGLGHFDG